MYECPLCSRFAAKSLKGVIRHLGVVHANEAGFYVHCVVEDCPQTYNKFLSYKKHMYSKHRDLLGITPANNDVTGLDSDQTDLDGSSSDMDIYDSFSEDISTFSRNEAALFVLKARHVHKVAQSSICEVMCDFTSLLERSVHKLHSRVFEILDDIDPVMKNEVTVAFNSQDVLDPFRGMTTEHMQHSFFKKTFHLLVRGYFLIRIPTNGFFLLIGTT